MNNFVRNLITEWRSLKLPFEDETFVVAVSGGADSLSLMLALYELRERKKLDHRFVIAHFNHDLRGIESETDEEFVKKLSAEYDFELALAKGKIISKENLEQKARIARYEFLTKTAQNLNAKGVLTAHTLNDQAETFLINLIRGSGLKGLGGMKPFRFLEEIKKEKDESENQSKIQNPKSKILLVRPLLTWAKREMTEKFCVEKGINYRYDTMNDDEAFKRVRIRKILIPLLEDFNPKIIENLAKTSFLLQDDFVILEKIQSLHLKEFEKFFSEKRPKPLPISELKNLFPSMLKKILRDWLRGSRGNLRGLDTRHFEAIENLIHSRKSGKIVELPGKDFVKKENGQILYLTEKG